MALLTAQTVDRSGLSPTYSAVSASDTFTPNDRTVLHVKNGSGSSINVNLTVTAPAPKQNVVYTATRTVAVPAGQERIIGPFDSQFFADPTTGLATVGYSATTSVTAALLYLTNA